MITRVSFNLIHRNEIKEKAFKSWLLAGAQRNYATIEGFEMVVTKGSGSSKDQLDLGLTEETEKEKEN